MKILKFGGTSVKNAQNINKAINIIKKVYEKERLAIVVSAFGGITDQLIEVSSMAANGDENYKTVFKEIEKRHLDTINELIKKDKSSALDKTNARLRKLKDFLDGIFLVKELTLKTKDTVISFGERLSAFIISCALNENNIESEYLDSREVIKTDSCYGNASVNFEQTNQNIQNYFKEHWKTQVIPGFIGSNDKGQTTTIGRGGSDYTSAIFAAAMDVSQLEIWTDVDGMKTADPRIVKDAFTIKSISYSEALELSHFGSKVINPQTISPALSKDIPILIKNTFNPEAEGTLICEKAEDRQALIRGISSIDNVSLITIQGTGLKGVVGIATRLFQTIANASINIILITQGSSEHSITFAVLPGEGKVAKELIEKEFELELKLKLIEPIIVETELSIIALVGENMKNTPGISARFFTALGRNGISVIATAQGASELNISAVIEHKHIKKALNAAHETFFLSDTKTLNVFAVGTGTVGGALLDQISKQSDYLIKHNGIDIKVIGVINAFNSIIDENGIELSNWRDQLAAGESPDLRAFVNKIKELNLRNSIFVDNTASKDVASLFNELLTSSISVVTPNKIANASPIADYEELHRSASKYDAQFFYETNVGAGLPVISTLRDLIHSGDEIIKIEAILSGSLNFIFSTFDEKNDFCSTVKRASKEGYTEPDPRLDLNGMDVARKILILAREIGMKINIEDIDIENCLTKQSQEAIDIDELWKTLGKHDNPVLEEKRKNAAKEGKRLKYIATLENGKASTAIKAVSSDHPFFNIVGVNNIVSFTTARYNKNPLLVVGPGAGAEVTAAGVFADIIRIANF